MKIRNLVVLLLLCSATMLSAQKKVSILGDSYSAFDKSIPAGNAWWYSDKGPQAANDVTSLSEMWWHQLIARKGYQLEMCNAYSGATVCYTGYGGRDFTSISFVTRMRNLGNPDIILILGGTNDDWAHAPVGGFKYEGQTQEDLKSFRPAFAYMLAWLKENHPKAQIVNIVNSELSETVTASMETICKHYGIKNVQLHQIEKQSSHPSVNGMKAICDQVAEALK